MAPRHMTQEQKQMARRLKAKGLTLKEIARDLSCSLVLVTSTVYARRPETGRPDAWTPAPGRLSAEEREEILLGLARGERMAAIARSLGRATSTITREVAANGGALHYGAWKAHCRAGVASRRPKPAKLAHPPLVRKVTTWLEQLWSPQEIAERLRLEFPDDPMMQVSHETIYQSLFVQGRGELRRELARCLRSGRTARRHQGRVDKRGKNPDMVMISDRPAEIEDRAVPGHWEGDLILGTGNKSAVGTLVERSTRFVLLLHLPDDHGAQSVETAMRKAIRKLPQELARSITWDQGREMAGHANFTVATGVPIYFCDPHSPWQRGSNENTNGLLRQYMPKSTDLSKHSAADLARFQRSLNGRPRKTLGYMKPSEKFAELVALTP
ncbi:MAG TPA: IS30 family transposase [Acidimicrobiales bacterium]|nr:IS30 family transposase [Acidimicrobiales bacterium]